MKKIIFLCVMICIAVLGTKFFINDYSTKAKNLEIEKKYGNCELGDLVGDDVQRLQLSGYYIDYHSEDFTQDQAKKILKDCLKQGVYTQYQMDCCITGVMYQQ